MCCLRQWAIQVRRSARPATSSHRIETLTPVCGSRDEGGFLWLLVPDTAYVALPPVGAGLALFHAWVYSLALYISSAGLIGRRAIFLVPVHASLVSPQEQVPFLKVQLNLERDRVPDLQKREGLRVVPDG